MLTYQLILSNKPEIKFYFLRLKLLEPIPQIIFGKKIPQNEQNLNEDSTKIIRKKKTEARERDYSAIGRYIFRIIINSNIFVYF